MQTGPKGVAAGMRLDDKVVRQTINDIVRRRLTSARIVNVDVRSGFDSDGDPVLRVTVVFASEPTAQDTKKMVGLVRHIRTGLNRSGADSFPLLSYVSRREASKLELAAA